MPTQRRHKGGERSVPLAHAEPSRYRYTALSVMAGLVPAIHVLRAEGALRGREPAHLGVSCASGRRGCPARGRA